MNFNQAMIVSNKMTFIVILFFCISFQSCTDYKKDIHMPILEKQLTETKNNQLKEIYDFQEIIIYLKANYSSERVSKIVYVSRKIDSIAMNFVAPSDTLMFFSQHDSILKKMFFHTLNVIQTTVNYSNDNSLNERFSNLISQIEYVEMNVDDGFREINYLSNQINLLSFLEMSHNYLLRSISSSDVDFYYAFKKIKTEKGRVGEICTSFLTFVYVDRWLEKHDPKLVKMTCDGKDIKVDYHFSNVNYIPTFNFTPPKSGFYEWTVYNYRMIPTGEYKKFPYSGKVHVK